MKIAVLRESADGERRVAATLQRSDGTWFADYVRLRFIMRKPY